MSRMSSTTSITTAQSHDEEEYEYEYEYERAVASPTTERHIASGHKASGKEYLSVPSTYLLRCP